MVNQAFKGDAIISDGGRQHEVEGYGISVVDKAIYFWKLFVDGAYLDVLSDLGGEAMVVVWEYFSAYYLKGDGDSFVEAFDEEEVVLKVLVAVIVDLALGNRAFVFHLLYE